MAADLHVQFRLPAPFGKKLKGAADLHGTSHNFAARRILIESLESTLRQDLVEQISALQEDLAEARAALREQSEELRAFRAEFNAALRKTAGTRG
jgi:hypothetical protein